MKAVAPSRQFSRDKCGDFLSLRQQFVGIVTGNHGLGTFIHKTGKNTFIVVFAEVTIHPNQVVDIRFVQHTHTNRYHLQIFGTSQRLQIDWPRSDVVNDRAFEPRNVEIQSFIVNRFLHAQDTVENHRTMTTLDGVDGVERAIAKATSEHKGSGSTASSGCGSSGSTSRSSFTSAATFGNVLCHFLECILEFLRHDYCFLFVLSGGSRCIDFY
mmetsp:Transcript_832/g.1726  ORF Transcript_832/g.1726 Transcript_832/m.1726 type:complete len:213 (-) Transcript_832:82-720(-)